MVDVCRTGARDGIRGKDLRLVIPWALLRSGHKSGHVAVTCYRYSFPRHLPLFMKKSSISRTKLCPCYQLHKIQLVWIFASWSWDKVIQFSFVHCLTCLKIEMNPLKHVIHYTLCFHAFYNVALIYYTRLSLPHVLHDPSCVPTLTHWW